MGRTPLGSADRGKQWEQTRGMRGSWLFQGPKCCQWSWTESRGIDFHDRLLLTSAVVLWLKVKDRQGQPVESALYIRNHYMTVRICGSFVGFLC